MAGGWGPFLAGLEPSERRSRVRELRALAWLLLGEKSPLVARLASAELEPEAEQRALSMIDGLPSRVRRRLLCTYAWLSRTRLPGAAT